MYSTCEHGVSKEVTQDTADAIIDVIAKLRHENVLRMLGCWVSELEPVVVGDMWGTPRVVLDLPSYVACMRDGADMGAVVPIVGPLLTMDQEDALISELLARGNSKPN